MNLENEALSSLRAIAKERGMKARVAISSTKEELIAFIGSSDVKIAGDSESAKLEAAKIENVEDVAETLPKETLEKTEQEKINEYKRQIAEKINSSSIGSVYHDDVVRYSSKKRGDGQYSVSELFTMMRAINDQFPHMRVAINLSDHEAPCLEYYSANSGARMCLNLRQPLRVIESTVRNGTNTMPNEFNQKMMSGREWGEIAEVAEVTKRNNREFTLNYIRNHLVSQESPESHDSPGVVKAY